MLITDSKTLKELKKEFSAKFPYLKIEFYKDKHEDGQASHVKKQLEDHLPINEVRTDHTEGDFRINGHLKVSTFESRIRDQYGLNVQVFRRSGNLWLQTTTTDHWTLSEQNGKGQRSEKSYQKMHEEES
ncbi:MAG: hypothetical protein AAFZ15_27265 [Bacteroidota bacterium]